MIHWMKYRWLYLLISGTVIAAGMFSLLKWGLKIGVDFKGGAVIEYRLEKPVSTEVLTVDIEKDGTSVISIQKTTEGTFLIKLPSIDTSKKDAIKKEVETATNGKVDELRFENVGPSVGPELVNKTLIGMGLSALGILLWVAYQFKNVKFGVCAVLAMFHDSLVMIGTYAIFSHFFGAEVDLLFVTALLTVLSFSVHDTIIVYDRIRESRFKLGENIRDLADRATTETMVRSLNNTFTEIMMLLALFLLGGTTVKWFAAALMVGMFSGAYSSPFVAVSLLVTWDELEKRFRKI